MIKSLTITNHLGDSIKLELTKPENSGFIVKSIDGLGPVKANINTSTAGASDGSFYNSARLNSRSIVMSLKFLPIGKENVEDIRLRSYKYFPIKKKIQIVVETDRRVLQTSGYVEANEPNIFSRDEGCSITINCPDPLFYAPVLNETNFNGVKELFEFPFSNESLSTSLIEFGEIVSTPEETVYYDGDGEVGIVMEIHAVGDVKNITILNLDTDEKMRLDTSKTKATYGLHPEWVSGKTYNPCDIVCYDHKTYICFREYSGTPDDTYEKENTYWVDYESEYPAFGTSSGYDGYQYFLGDTVTSKNKKWIMVDARYSGANHYSDALSPGGSYDVWLDVTDLYPPPYRIVAGDTITIDTRKGNKSITLLRDGVKYNILNALDKNSSWLTLVSGNNSFVCDAESGVSNLQFKICNNIVYDGV